MANNRIYIRCKGCGGVLFLGTRFGGGYHWYNYAKYNNVQHANDPNYTKQNDSPLEDKLNHFYGVHEWCGGTLDHFDIMYEMGGDV